MSSPIIMYEGDTGTVSVEYTVEVLRAGPPGFLWESLAHSVSSQVCQPVTVTRVVKQEQVHTMSVVYELTLRPAGPPDNESTRSRAASIHRQIMDIVGPTLTGGQQVSGAGYARVKSNPLITPVYGAYQPEPDDSVTYSPYPVLGWRAWNVMGATGSQLTGKFSAAWEMPWMNATCGKGYEHQSPYWDCNCGIYAVKDPRELYREGPAIGLVAMRSVIEHEEGYRARQVWILAMNRWSVMQGSWQSVADRPYWAMLDFSRDLRAVADYYTRNPDRIPGPPDPWRAYPDEERQADWDQSALIYGADIRDKRRDPWAE